MRLPAWIEEEIAAGRVAEVLRSNAGYYIGSLDEDGLPTARYSREYWPKEAPARQALLDGTWTPKPTP